MISFSTDSRETALRALKKVKLITFAESLGESLNGFINRAIDETMQRDEKEV